MTRAAIAVACALGISGCGFGATRYDAAVVARGELTLRYDDGLVMVAGEQPVSRGRGWEGLHRYVRCVPEAAEHAQKARRDGVTGRFLSVIGGTLGIASLGGLVGYGLDDPQRAYVWLVGGVGVAVLGAVFAGVGRILKNSANGHAVDALNFYNDAVGSLGATCADLRYPAPVGEVAPPPPPALPSAPPPPPQSDGDDIP